MRIGSLAIGLSIAATLAAGGASAGTLASATWTQYFEGRTQSIQGVALTVTNSGATCTDPNPNRVPGAGFLTCPTAGLQATGTTTGTAYNVSLTMPLFEMQAFTTGGQINLATRASLSGAQTIAGNALSATGSPGIEGMVTVGGAMHTMNSAWTQPVGGTLLRLPLHVGKAGRYSWSLSVLGTTFTITIDFYGWSAGTRTFTGLTSRFMSLPDVVAMGSFDLTARGGGTVTLVAPSKISIDGYAQQRTASFTTLKLTFVPEPATPMLLGAGALALLRCRRSN